MKIIKTIWSFLLDMAEAKYAADLARNGKIKESQAIYK
jgi:hypothetical protein